MESRNSKRRGSFDFDLNSFPYSLLFQSRKNSINQLLDIFKNTNQVDANGEFSERFTDMEIHEWYKKFKKANPQGHITKEQLVYHFSQMLPPEYRKF